MLASRIEKAFLAPSFADFTQQFWNLYDDFKRGILQADKDKLNLLSGEKICSNFIKFWNLQAQDVRKIRRKNHAKSPQAMAQTLHAIAHIEMSAIVLSLDSAYRFYAMPHDFYADWLQVASEEIGHFQRLCKLLNELGFTYGDFNIHGELFSALCATQDSLELRMGIVHRGLEAKGLDANPFVQQKLLANKHALNSEIKEVLDIILYEEIGHVSKGDRWWKHSSKRPFIELAGEFSFRLAGKILNRAARLESGFSDDELDTLEHFYADRL